jgi:hypothetical protein
MVNYLKHVPVIFNGMTIATFPYLFLQTLQPLLLCSIIFITNYNLNRPTLIGALYTGLRLRTTITVQFKKNILAVC